MATFDPSGFTPLNDVSTSSPFDATLLKCPMNPAISYFAGDVATMQLFTNAGDPLFPSDSNVLQQGLIYPMAIAQNIPVEIEDNINISYTKLGVFMYFQYTPANSKIAVQANNFIGGTQLAPGTQAYAFVSCSPTMTYSAQIIAPTGVPENYRFSQFYIASENTFVYGFNVVSGGTSYPCTITFPLGDTSNGYLGRSQTYLNMSPTGEDSQTQFVPSTLSSFLLLGMNDIGDSDFSTSDTVILNPWGIFELQYQRLVDSGNN